MSDVQKKSPRTAYLVITLVFLLLGLSLSGLMTYYWQFVMGPRLFREGQEQATLVAQAQSSVLVNALSARDGVVEPQKLIDVIDHVLVFSDPVSKSPFFRSIAL